MKLKFTYRTPSGRTYSEIITDPEAIGLEPGGWEKISGDAKNHLIHTWARSKGVITYCCWYEDCEI